MHTAIRDAFKFFDHDQNGFIIISEFIMSMGHIRNNTPRAPVSVALRGVGRGPNDSIALTDDADTATAASIIHDAISYNSMGSDMREFFERYDYNGQGRFASHYIHCVHVPVCLCVHIELCPSMCRFVVLPLQRW